MATPISKITLTIDNRDYIFGLQRAEAETKKFGNEAATAFTKADAASNKLNISANNLTGGLLKLRGTLATIGLGAFVISSLKGADAIADLSDATDISIGKLLEFEKGLIAAGGKGEDAAKAITGFYDSIQQANSGSDKTQEQFAKLGVSLQDLRTLSESDLLDKTLKGFKNIQDPVLKSTLAVDLFSKAFKTVDPNKLSDELETLRGTLGEQEKAAIATSKAIERFDKFIGNLRGAVILLSEPLLKFSGLMEGSVVSTEKLASALKTLLAGYVALKVAIFTNIVAQAALNGLMAAGAAKSPAAAGLALAAAGIAGGLAFDELNKILENVEKQAGKTSNAVNIGLNTGSGPRTTPTPGPRNRPQEVGKELQGQIDAVNRLTEGYRRAAQSNMDRYTAEVNLLGKTEYEIELEKGRGEIEKRYADQTAALEDKKKGAKGSTLALIQKSIKELGVLKSSELDIFEITRRQTLEYKLQQDEIKRVGDEIERQIARQGSLGDAIREANKKAFEAGDALPASRFVGLSSLQRQTLEIQESARKAGMAAREAYAANFGDIVTIQDAEEFARGLDQIAGAYGRVAGAQIEVLNANYAISRSFDTGVKDAFTAFKESATNTADQVKNSFTNFTQGFEDAFVRMVQTGKLSFKDLANSILSDLARIAVKKAIVGMASLFGFAAGGQVMADTPIIVGERGPELFVPRSAGAIVPNNALAKAGSSRDGGGQTLVTYNISAVDAASFRTMVARDPSFIYAVTEQGRRSQPTRRFA